MLATDAEHPPVVMTTDDGRCLMMSYREEVQPTPVEAQSDDMEMVDEEDDMVK